MSTNILLTQIAQFNKLKYNNLTEVDNYLNKRYHSIRLEISRKIIKSFFKQNLDVKILDIAASTCVQANKLKNEGYDVVASDIEFLPLQYGSKKYGINCLQLDASIIFPFKDEQFEVVFMGELIEHLFNTTLLLSECLRILKPGGIIIITTPNLASLQDRILFLFGLSPRHVSADHEYLNLHIRPFTLSSLKKILLNSGFDTIKIKAGLVRIRLKNGKRINSRLLAKLFPGLGANLIAVAQKRIP